MILNATNNETDSAEFWKALQEWAPGSSLIFLLHIIDYQRMQACHINGTPSAVTLCKLQTLPFK